jgi:carbamoyl-phosphate synthase small subunit
MTRGQKTTIALADGTIFYGQSFGDSSYYATPRCAELVFNTAMSGYQEILTDPSYAGQFVTFSYPHIGNVGCNSQDNESDRVHAAGLVCRNEPTEPSNFRAQESLGRFLERNKIAGVCSVDTRSLVLHLRDNGSQMSAIGHSDKFSDKDLVVIARAAGSMAGKEYVSVVSTKSLYVVEPPFSISRRYNLACIDCGVKRTMLDLLAAQGCRVTVFPYSSTPKKIVESNPDAIFFSNGPGDPATLDEVVATAKAFLGKLPLFGICLGHQILAQALGGATYKLPFGHRGANHPVLDCLTGRVEITVQNHGFAVDEASLKNSSARVSHRNLNDGTVEGLYDHERRIFSVQYHPESSPGPHDARYVFDKFFSMIEDKVSFGELSYASK